MQIKKENNKIIVILNAGEEIIASLAKLAKDENIPSANISGIGALGHAVLGYYAQEQGGYARQEFSGNLELISLLGNISWFDNEPVVHLHACVGSPDYMPRAGHLFEGTVTVTAEIILDIMTTKLERQQDQQFDFKKINLPD